MRLIMQDIWDESTYSGYREETNYARYFGLERYNLVYVGLEYLYWICRIRVITQDMWDENNNVGLVG